MQPDGKMVDSNINAQNEIKKILFTPNSFTIGPGEKQVVRFFIRDSIVNDELRTYAHILSEIKEDEKEEVQKKETTTSLTPKVAIAIPIIYRSKNQKENIVISDETFTQKNSDCVLNAKWVNKHHSSYINVELFDKGNETVFKLNGISNFLNEYNWNLVMSNLKCDKIKSIKIFDVDNEHYVIDKKM